MPETTTTSRARGRCGRRTPTFCFSRRIAASLCGGELGRGVERKRSGRCSGAGTREAKRGRLTARAGPGATPRSPWACPWRPPAPSSAPSRGPSHVGCHLHASVAIVAHRGRCSVSLLSPNSKLSQHRRVGTRYSRVIAADIRYLCASTSAALALCSSWFALWCWLVVQCRDQVVCVCARLRRFEDLRRARRRDVTGHTDRSHTLVRLFVAPPRRRDAWDPGCQRTTSRTMPRRVAF